jgi:glycosyltransferase involved in cell wall biosynthesis
MMMAHDLPLVSIVTPSFNQAQFLEQTMLSVLSQDYPNLEYLVIDGGSQDGSLEIIQRYASRLAWWVSEPDAGQAAAINKGFEHTRGEIIAWLNSDDLYFRPDTVRRGVEALEAHPNVGMVYADGVMVDGELHVLDWHTYPQYSVKDLLAFNVLLQPTVLMRRETLERAGYLSKDYHMILDHSLWIKIAALTPILHISETWAVERTHSDAKTIGQAGKFVDEAFRFIQALEQQAEFKPFFTASRKEIYAGLHVFAGKRLIDAGEPRLAVDHFRQAWRLSPRAVLPVWYKVVQAEGNSLGLERLFLTYRKTRRKIQYSRQQLKVDENGVHLVEI